MSRFFVIATLLAFAASGATLPVLWDLSQSYLNEGHGLHPFLCGAGAVGLAVACGMLATLLLSCPRGARRR
jgi:hypothetical protein